MYTLYRETDPATTIDHSAYCHFLGGPDKQLVTIGAHHLRVFRLNPFVLSKDEKEGWKQTSKLECVLSTNLLVPTQSLAFAKTPLAPGDCLLLGLDEAKLSVVAYDRATHDVRTVSLHSYEEEILRGGFTRDFPTPIVRADPDSRCAAMLVYGHHLAILPLTATGGDLFDDDPMTKKTNLFSYTVPLESLDGRLQNVTDMCFLHGYYEPTLLFLYEPMQTTAGRASIRQDTYCILGVSLNVKDRVQAVVWQVGHLPLDCFRVSPVVKPVGGAVVFGTNEIIYLNQSVPPCGVATNSCMDGMTQFPLKSQQHQRVALDGSAVDFISTTSMALVARDGRLFVITLLIDNTNAVKDMHMDCAADTVIPYTVTACGDGFLFIGSRLGDSQLLKYSESEQTSERLSAVVDQRSAKRPRLSGNLGDSQGDGLDDFALYGEMVAVTTAESVPIAEYKFESIDHLLNIGPCKTMCAGSPSQLPEVFQTGRIDPIFDLVTSSGHGKNGAIVALQRTIRPQILTSSSIPGALEIWTVGRRDEEGSHQFLLVSKEVMTMVLELENEIAELDSSGFIMDQRTVAAGDLDEGRFIVQIAPMSIVLLKERVRVQELELDISFPVSRATICDPHICLLTENGDILYLQVVPTGQHGNMQIIIHRPAEIQHSPATAISLYRDVSGLFMQSSGEQRSRTTADSKSDIQLNRSQRRTSESDHPPAPVATNGAAGPADDEDDFMLYGEIDNSSSKFSSVKQEPGPLRGDILPDGSVPRSSSLHDPNTVMPSFWLAVARENGHLEIFSVPELQLVYVVRKFPCTFGLLYDTDPNGMTVEEHKTDSTEQTAPVRELLLTGMGINQARPLLMAVVDDQVVIYETFAFDQGIEDHLAIRFKRLPKSVLPRNERLTLATGKPRVSPVGELDRFPPILHAFDGVGDQGPGVFIAGPYPMWVLLRSGQVRVHPMTLDGPVRSFTPFNNANCPLGFLYLTVRNDDMRICQLPTDMELDAPSPTRKIDIGRTVHFVFYMLQSNTYTVVTSEQRPNRKLCVLVSDEKTFETHDKDANFVYPTIDWYRLELFSPDNWQPIPNVGDITFDEFELVTTTKEVLLKSEATVSGFQNYLAVGTTSNYGEEVLVRGRIIICEIIDVVPEPGQPNTRHRVKTIYDKEQKGPISSMCSCQGYLLTGMGQKVYIWLFRDNDLQGISFLDMHFYVHQLIGLRNLALAADLYRSVSLLRYQENCKALSLVSRDFRPTPQQAVPMGIEFIVDNRQLAMLMSDENGNISVFTYQPEAKESLGGQRLILRGDMHVGARIANFVRVRGHVSDGVVENKVQSSSRHVCLFGTLDGALGVLMPLSEKVYRRLHMLQSCLGTHTPHVGGLNPRGARISRGPRNSTLGVTQQSSRNIVDGDVVWDYVHLSAPEKLEIAKRLGTTKQQLMDDLIELERVSTHY